MQEPKRISLLDVILKSLAVANRRAFIHRLIYVVKLSEEAQNGDAWLRLVERNVRELNEDRWDETIAGLGLFSPGFIINILEGTEDLLDKHVSSLMDALGKEKCETHVKILAMVPHVIKRYFVSWQGVTVKPLVLLQSLPATQDLQEHAAKARECIFKLYKLSEFFSQQTETGHRTVITELTKSCRKFLPETALLDFLLSSPLLQSGEDFVQSVCFPPPSQLYHELVYPPPPDFVPQDTLNDSE